MISVPSPSPCPEPRQKPAGKDVQSLFSGGSSSVSSTMLSQGLSRLLQLSVLLLLVQPLDPSSHAAGDTGTWDALPQALEEQEAMAPMRDTMLFLEALPWICAAVALILRGIYLGWTLVRGLRRRWGEVREGLGQVGRCRGPPRPRARRVWGEGREPLWGSRAGQAPRVPGLWGSPLAKALAEAERGLSAVLGRNGPG